MKHLLLIIGISILAIGAVFLMPNEPESVSEGADEPFKETFVSVGGDVEQPLNVGGPVNPPTYFAEIGKDGKVLNVLVITQEMLNTGRWGDPANWIETKMDGTLRQNYAGIGYTYNETLNAFIPPKPTSTATLDVTKARWILPVVEKPVRVATST